MKTKYSLFVILLLIVLYSFGQERVVYVDFESSSFKNNPTIPFDKPFVIQGEVFKDVKFVEVEIFNENSEKSIHTFTWNRGDNNNTETFSIVVPGILKSNSKYDIKIKTYKLMSNLQKQSLADNMSQRIRHYLLSNFIFNGQSVEINKSKKTFHGLQVLISEGLTHIRTKNNIELTAPSSLILSQMETQREFRFNDFLKKTKVFEKDSLANSLIDNKVEHLVDIIMAEIMPFINSDLVQHHRMVLVRSVLTDKEPFTMPVNFGMYAWSKSVDINNTQIKNLDFTLGVGITVPFANRSTLLSKSKFIDSYGYSIGVLLKPVKDANGTSYITPGIKLPVYTGIGVRFFKVIRLNAGILILAENGVQDFTKLSILPTAGLAIELNLWMGIKK
ncbi:MAG: hypothetical protein RBR97_05180 [Bacteroidales bacterium]|nr:hypothetical protein [Bacteroidales bacterium]